MKDNTREAELFEGIQKRIGLYSHLLVDATFRRQFGQALAILLTAIKENKKILIFGNGGSAAEAQHFVAELVCQFQKKRKAIAAIALTTDSSILTAQSNDFGFETVFSRQVEALCAPKDVVIGLTTSDWCDGGHSQNILLAFEEARTKRGVTIGLFSQRTRKLLEAVDQAVVMPSDDTALIQEAHLMIIHELCREIELLI